MIQVASMLYVAICLGTSVFLLSLILGAPWGYLTQGGKNSGALPIAARVGAGVSIVIVASMAAALVSATGAWPNWPSWSGWVALGVQVLSTLMNLITPSRPERLLWGPVTVVMLLCALVIMTNT